MMRENRTLRLTIITLMMLFVAVGCVAPQEKAAPAKPIAAEDWKFHSIADVNFVKQYVATPPREDVMIIDSRPKRAKYDKGHIPNAVSLPDSQFDKLKDKLPQDKDTLLIFYCGGYT